METGGFKNNAAPDPWDIGFGAVLFVLALLALFAWFPLDIRGGFVETDHAGKLAPGDAFFPVILTCTILVLAGLSVIGNLLWRRQQDDDASSGGLTRANLVFLAAFHAIVVAGLAIMYWLGPLVVALLDALGTMDLTYRQLVDTAPYKYIGYAAGGFLMTAGLIAWSEGRLTRRAVFTVLTVIAACVVIFDVLLINVQLPPNADY